VAVMENGAVRARSTNTGVGLEATSVVSISNVSEEGLHLVFHYSRLRLSDNYRDLKKQQTCFITSLCASALALQT
jgi:hypothetical protein